MLRLIPSVSAIRINTDRVYLILGHIHYVRVDEWEMEIGDEVDEVHEVG